MTDVFFVGSLLTSILAFLIGLLDLATTFGYDLLTLPDDLLLTTEDLLAGASYLTAFLAGEAAFPLA